MASSSSSSITLTHGEKYDVFLSFRGEDTSDNFTSHLHDALCRKQIETFIDYYQLKRGDEKISPAHLEAIELSKISVVIFSKEYASAKWCLDELVKILECKKMRGQMVIPVFYQVNPSEVRKQTGCFKAAFVKHEKHFKKMTVQRWRSALTEASNLSEWDSSVIRPESKLVDGIVKDILKKLNDISPSSDIEGLVGIESRIERIKSLLCIGLLDFRVIGIWGMGGIGKTTIAGVVFNQISSHFEGFCFMGNVREESEKCGGLHRLREKALSKVLEEDNLNIDTPNVPLCLKDRLRRKKVFIVLDDVSTLDQLEFLTGGIDRFGPGSRIIITTRDKQLLYNYGVKNLYEVEAFNNHEALELFSKYAFKENHPRNDLLELSNGIVMYAKGNPLALKVLGSSLHGKSKQDWKEALNKLKKIANPDIHNVLKISYDMLDEELKNIFLDVSCFFRGRDKDFVAKLLGGGYFSPHLGLNALVDKSLITISDNYLRMHDLLQEMGQQIVRQESPKEPGKRSRLWNHDDVYRVLKKNTGTGAVEGIFLDVSKTGDIHLSFGAFANMYNLKYLELEDFRDISKVHLPQGLEYLSDELRYLHWHRYPLKTLPSNYSPENLVELNLRHSNVQQLWEGTKDAVKLKSIDLSHSEHLTGFPDLSGSAPHLESIKLERCTSLLDIPPSIQYHNKLTTLSLDFCKSLRSFPSNIHFGSLENLSLSCCTNLTKFPQISGNIKRLSLRETAIEEVPSSIECLTELSILDLGVCTRLKSLPTSICKLKSLEKLDVGGCSKLENIPEILEKMEHLEHFHLWGTAIKALPSSVDHLNGLGELRLMNCKNLETLPESIGNLRSVRRLHISNCPELDKLPENLWSLRSLHELTICGFTGLVLPPLSGICLLREINLGHSSLTEIPEDLGYLLSLFRLDLRGNNFERIPTSIKNLSQLNYLILSDCNMLQSLPELPLRLTYFEANHCKRLLSLPELPSCLEQLDTSELEIASGSYHPTKSTPFQFMFINCLKLNQKAYNNPLAVSQLRIQHMATTSLRHCNERVNLHPVKPRVSFCLPGSDVPDWFGYQSSGSSVTIKLPQHCFNSNFIGFALCAVITFEEYHSKDYCFFGIDCKCQFESNYSDRVNIGSSYSICSFDDCRIVFDSDHIVIGYDPCLSGKLLKGDYTTALFEFRPMQCSGRFCKVKCCGVFPLYAEPNMTQPSISIENFSATSQDFGETMVEECTKINLDEANTTGSCSSDEEEVEVASNSFADFVFFGF